ncbi:hypothetical protein ACWD04_07615 [Streptomyces sp. NPDC002911]
MMYTVIASTQYATRCREAEPGEVHMWAFPCLTLASIAFIAGVLVLMADSCATPRAGAGVAGQPPRAGSSPR